MGGGGGGPPSRQKAVFGVFERFPNYDDDDGCSGMVRLDPPVCDGYLHWGNCRICYVMLAAYNDDFNFDNEGDDDGQGWLMS